MSWPGYGQVYFRYRRHIEPPCLQRPVWHASVVRQRLGVIGRGTLSRCPGVPSPSRNKWDSVEPGRELQSKPVPLSRCPIPESQQAGHLRARPRSLKCRPFPSSRLRYGAGIRVVVDACRHASLKLLDFLGWLCSAKMPMAMERESSSIVEISHDGSSHWNHCVFPRWLCSAKMPAEPPPTSSPAGTPARASPGSPACRDARRRRRG